MRHVCNISGGKDSAALAIFLKEKGIGGGGGEVEYVFADTGAELPETYEFVDRLEKFLETPIARVKSKRENFEGELAYRGGWIPSFRHRWCTPDLKIKPINKYLGNDDITQYIGIRYDELERSHNGAYSPPNIRVTYPFIDNCLMIEDIKKILEKSGVGMPAYYDWRTRSGCFFCFFQRKIEWVGLLERHPDLYAKAIEYEKVNPFLERVGVDLSMNKCKKMFTWSKNESLEQLAQPERVKKIKEWYLKHRKNGERPLTVLMDDDDERCNLSCNHCHL